MASSLAAFEQYWKKGDLADWERLALTRARFVGHRPRDRELSLEPDPFVVDADPGHALVRNRFPGQMSSYSSANWMLVQALIEVHGGGFLSHMGGLLSDLGMTQSTYLSPYPLRNDGNFARGWTGTSVEPMVAYGETAAASLVSTPGDIARFVIAVNTLAADTAATAPLSSTMVNRFIGRNGDIRPPQDYGTCQNRAFGNQEWGLGVRWRNTGNTRHAWRGNEHFTHGGVHNGYRTQMFGFPQLNSGVVVFMTGDDDDANAFFGEFRRAFTAAYL